MVAQIEDSRNPQIRNGYQFVLKLFVENLTDDICYLALSSELDKLGNKYRTRDHEGGHRGVTFASKITKNSTCNIYVLYITKAVMEAQEFRDLLLEYLV